MTAAQKMQLVMTAIAAAKPDDSFADVIISCRNAFSGLKVMYATNATHLDVQAIALSEIQSACALVRSFLDGRGLLFYTDDIYRRTLAGHAKVQLDFSVSLDKNVAEAIRCFVAGKQYPKPDLFHALLVLLKGRGELSFNFDYLSYLVEELEHFGVARNGRPLETLVALKRLDDLSADALVSSPAVPSFVAPASRAAMAAGEAMRWFSNTPEMTQLQVKRLGIYALLLHAAVTSWKGKLNPKQALAEAFRFSQDVLGRFAKTEVYFAWKLIGQAETPHRFFLPASSPTAGSLRKLRSMSWDLAMFRMAEMASTIQRREGEQKADFFIPLVASYDERFKQLVEACPLKAIIIAPNDGLVNSVFRDELAFQIQLQAAIGGTSTAALNDPAAQLRRRLAAFDESRIRRVVAELEQEARVLGAD